MAVPMEHPNPSWGSARRDQMAPVIELTLARSLPVALSPYPYSPYPIHTAESITSSILYTTLLYFPPLHIVEYPNAPPAQHTYSVVHVLVHSTDR